MKKLFDLNKIGENIYNRTQKSIGMQYTEDYCLLNPLLLKLLIFACIVVDGVLFYQILGKYAVGGEYGRVAAVVGFLMGFELIPCMQAIIKKQIEEKRSKNYGMVTLAFILFLIAFFMNLVFRYWLLQKEGGIYVIKQGTETLNFFALGKFIFGSGLPIITSGFCYLATAILYSPIKTKLIQYEKVINKKKDEIRRIRAILSDYELEMSYAKNRLLVREDQNYNDMIQAYRVGLENACEFTRQTIMQRVDDPVALKVIGKTSCEKVLNLFDQYVREMEDKSHIENMMTEREELK